jgi:solute carrier family 25, member 38
VQTVHTKRLIQQKHQEMLKQQDDVDERQTQQHESKSLSSSLQKDELNTTTRHSTTNNITSGTSNKMNFPIINLCAGVTSGCISTLLLQPFDVLKTRLISPNESQRSMFRLTKTIVKNDGIISLWRGTQPALIRITTGAAAYFTIQSYLIQLQLNNREKQIKKKIEFDSNYNSHSRSQIINSKSPEKLSSIDYMVIGGVSRAAAVTLCCPLSVIKTRREGQSKFTASNNANTTDQFKTSSYSASQEAKISITNELSTVYRLHGLRGLYAALLPSIAKDAPYHAIYLATYTKCKQMLTNFECKYNQNNQIQYESNRAKESAKPNQKDTAKWHIGTGAAIQFTSGLFAASGATILFQPAEVIKTRMQLATLQSNTTSSQATSTYKTNDAASTRHIRPDFQKRQFTNYISIIAECKSVMSESGFRGFFRGLLLVEIELLLHLQRKVQM